MSKQYKLLYAEDEIQTRQNHISYINDNYDIDTIEAPDGLIAWKYYLKHKPDILLTDISMPNMCGLELIEKIREVDENIKIIVLSAHSEEDKLLRAMKLNLVEYQIKPINRRKLRESLDSVINTIEQTDTKKIFYFNSDSYFNISANKLVINSETIKLTKNEIKLLNLLIKNENHIVSQIDIFNYIWDYHKEYKIESVRTLVKKLRKKLSFDCIDNVYGGGYRFFKENIIV